ncbi:hypothetical protein MTO96_006049 [Rhipicephalus appendiculatus]
MPAAKAPKGLPDRSAGRYPTMESRPHNDSTASTSTHPDTCASIQEQPDTFAVRRGKQRHVTSTPVTRAHQYTWLGGQSSGPKCIWLGCRRSHRSSPTVAATATAGSPSRHW